MEILLLAECGREGPGVRLSFWGLMGVGSAFSSRAASAPLAFRGEDMRSDLPEERLNALRIPMPNVYLLWTNSQRRRQERRTPDRSNKVLPIQTSTCSMGTVNAYDSFALSGG